MPATMNQKYIRDHQLHLHTPDSWGRAIAYQVLTDAGKSIGPKEVETAVLTGTFHVSPIEALGCIEVCYDTPIGPICLHVEI
jgi:hypothetical protein